MPCDFDRRCSSISLEIVLESPSPMSVSLWQLSYCLFSPPLLLAPITVRLALSWRSRSMATAAAAEAAVFRRYRWRTFQLVTKKMMEFHKPCRGRTAAVATCSSYGDWPRIQLWRRFMLLGIQVTRTLIANKKLVRRYARLTGSATINRRAAAFVDDNALLSGDGVGWGSLRLDASTEEKY